MSYVLAFIGFATLIILHEAGHFVAAKAVGMRVERFSLFFGPMILRTQRGETEYGVGVIPLGGYVKITGMNPNEELDPEVRPRAYYNQPVWKRIVVISAGPAVNLVIAFVIIWALFLSNGAASGRYDRVAQIIRPSAAAGVLHLGDTLVTVNGVSGDLTTLRRQLAGLHCAGPNVEGCAATEPVTIAVRRDGKLLTFHLRPRYNAADKRLLVGVDFSQSAHSIGPLHAASLSVTAMWNVTSQTVSKIATLFEPKSRAQIHGVVYSYSVTERSFSHDTTFAIQVLGLISLSLAVVNLFPFLPLDGGHIFWAIAEKVRGRRIPFEVMERAGLVGFVLIIVLFAIGLSNDISSLSGKALPVP